MSKIATAALAQAVTYLLELSEKVHKENGRLAHLVATQENEHKTRLALRDEKINQVTEENKKLERLLAGVKR